MRLWGDGRATAAEIEIGRSSAVTSLSRKNQLRKLAERLQIKLTGSSAHSLNYFLKNDLPFLSECDWKVTNELPSTFFRLLASEARGLAACPRNGAPRQRQRCGPNLSSC